jgi:DNA primase small subunit
MILLSTEDFGFQHLLWVFSGRRGVHCWISDQAAMALVDDARRTIVSYLELIKGGEGLDKRVNTRFGNYTGPMHPMLQEALEQVSERFADLVLEDQECFDTRERWEKLIALLPSDEQGGCSFRHESTPKC